MIKKLLIIASFLVPSLALATVYSFSDGQATYLYDISNPPTSNFDMIPGFQDGQAGYLLNLNAVAPVINASNDDAEWSSVDGVGVLLNGIVTMQ